MYISSTREKSLSDSHNLRQSVLKSGNARDFPEIDRKCPFVSSEGSGEKTVYFHWDFVPSWVKSRIFMMWVLLKLILHPLTLCPRPREAGMKCRLVVNWTSEVVNTTSINGKMIYNYFNNGKYRNKQSSRLHNQGAVAWISSAIQNVWHLTQKQNILNDCFQTVWGFYLKQKRWLNPFKSSKFRS